MMASWLARRIETQTRRLRRSLRDYERVQWRRIHAADRRARGLRLLCRMVSEGKSGDELRDDYAIAAATLCGGAGE